MKTINALGVVSTCCARWTSAGRSLAELHAATLIPKPSLLHPRHPRGQRLCLAGDRRQALPAALRADPAAQHRRRALAIGEIAAPFPREPAPQGDQALRRAGVPGFSAWNRRNLPPPEHLGVAIPSATGSRCSCRPPGAPTWLASAATPSADPLLADAALHPPCSSAAATLCCAAGCRPSSTNPAPRLRLPRPVVRRRRRQGHQRHRRPPRRHRGAADGRRARAPRPMNLVWPRKGSREQIVRRAPGRPAENRRLDHLA